MPTTVACPACAGKLRLPDDLAGRDVRCPRCDATFAAPATPPPEPDPAPPDLPLDLLPDPPPPSTPGLVGAVELKLSLDDDAPPRPPAAPHPPAPPGRPGRVPPPLNDEHDDLQTCPACGRQAHRDAARCPACGGRLAGDGPDLDWRRRSGRRSGRRDAEPHRGGTVLALGITGLCLTALPVVGAVLGVVAWVMGQGDLRKQQKGLMDPEGAGLTQAGWVCGIIATALNGLLTLACCGFLVIRTVAEESRPPRPNQWGPAAPAPRPPGPPGRQF